LLLGPELGGIHLLDPFVGRLLAQVGEERFNKLNPADMFVNLGGGLEWLRMLGWAVLALGAVFYAHVLWQVWRARSAEADVNYPLTPLVQTGMVAAYLWLPYTLAYDIVLVAGVYLWRFAAQGYQLSRGLVWNLGLLWLLPIMTLLLHAYGVPSTLNPLLILGLMWLLRTPLPRPAACGPAPPAKPGAKQVEGIKDAATSYVSASRATD
jgi:hypothetical protein